MSQLDRSAVNAELDRLTADFFKAVSFEAGEMPRYDGIRLLFIEAGLLIKNSVDSGDLYSRPIH